MQGILLSMIEIVCIVRGTVQGVRYRAFVEDAATTLGVTGSISNQTDGSVRVVAQGLPDVLKEFVEFLHEGSLRSVVVSVEVEWRQPTATYYDFSVLHT